MDHFKLPGGDQLSRDERQIVIKLTGRRKVLSTSHLNGGFREDLKYIFNFCDIHGSADERCEMRAATNEGHLISIAKELGLDPAVATGLSTAAHMRHARPHCEYYHDFSVTAIATAGIDVNGSRVGDPSCWHEKDGVPALEKPGTINILLLIDADLTEGAMARALVTCTEAKTAALQEVLAPSCYSEGLATGSGTDGTIILSNADSPTHLTNAGQHTKLGEYIGREVKAAVKESLVAESGFREYARGSLLKRIRRFGLNEELILKTALLCGVPGAAGDPANRALLKELDRDDRLIARTTLYVHILDLLQWKLIDAEDALEMAESLLLDMGVKKAPVTAGIPGESQNGAVTAELLDRLAHALASRIKDHRAG